VPHRALARVPRVRHQRAVAHTLAFLGSGRLGSAIIRGLLAKNIHAPAAIACTSKSGSTAQRLAAETGIVSEPDLARLLGPADIVVVAFKPQSLASADSRLAELTAGKLVISLLAGKRLARLAQIFPRARNLVRTMPNTPAAIGAGITTYCSQTSLTEADRATVERMLGALGDFLPLDEKHFDAVTALGGSGPGFVFEFVGALRDGGIAAGLPPEVAQRLATQTALGSLKLLATSGATPEALRDQVVSPNGTTFAGLQVLANARFRELMRDTIVAAARRADELSRD
jgi:pyrroline-5-carboxylate reductase